VEKLDDDRHLVLVVLALQRRAGAGAVDRDLRAVLSADLLAVTIGAGRARRERHEQRQRRPTCKSQHTPPLIASAVFGSGAGSLAGPPVPVTRVGVRTRRENR